MRSPLGMPRHEHFPNENNISRAAKSSQLCTQRHVKLYKTTTAPRFGRARLQDESVSDDALTSRVHAQTGQTATARFDGNCHLLPSKETKTNANTKQTHSSQTQKRNRNANNNNKEAQQATNAKRHTTKRSTARQTNGNKHNKQKTRKNLRLYNEKHLRQEAPHCHVAAWDAGTREGVHPARPEPMVSNPTPVYNQRGSSLPRLASPRAVRNAPGRCSGPMMLCRRELWRR